MFCVEAFEGVGVCDEWVELCDEAVGMGLWMGA